jgi:hypothetical protein
MYALVFVGLFLAHAGLNYGVDRHLASLLGQFSFPASAHEMRNEMAKASKEADGIIWSTSEKDVA